jgi:hypothetical protein
LKSQSESYSERTAETSAEDKVVVLLAEDTFEAALPVLSAGVAEVVPEAEADVVSFFPPLPFPFDEEVVALSGGLEVFPLVPDLSEETAVLPTACVAAAEGEDEADDDVPALTL